MVDLKLAKIGCKALEYSKHAVYDAKKLKGGEFGLKTGKTLFILQLLPISQEQLFAMLIICYAVGLN